MPVFTSQGTHARHLWLVDNSPHFSHFPGGIIDGLNDPLPIWLYVGTAAYGEVHIRKHAHWVSKAKKTIPEFVYEKLGQPGLIFNTEKEKKFKVSLRLTPSALLVLEYFDRVTPHFSVTSLYMHPATLDGMKLGRYPGRPKPPAAIAAPTILVPG
ncbi:MAG TPA: hypothetical protein VF801_12710 [Rhodocyclaceae bacterium]